MTATDTRRGNLRDQVRRAKAMTRQPAQAKPVTGPRHAAKPVTSRSRRAGKAAAALTAAVVVVVVGAAWFVTQTPSEPAAPSPAAVAVPQPPDIPIPPDATPLERTYLNELAEAGIELDQAGAVTAIAIADKHIAHGHLSGMREEIRRDFAAAFPRLNPEQVEIAKVVLVHHWRQVTGRQE